MPIKLPKTFGGRRKSSGNILEEVDAQQQSSFRVFERPGPHRSMTEGAPLSKRMSEGNAVPSTLEDPDNIFAGTEQPLRKRGPTYESSTSTRLSSSSTLPSSTEVPPPDEATSPHSRMNDIPVPPPLAAGLRAAAGRTFSFGGRFGKSSTPAPLPRIDTPDASTRRVQTASTDSTATPPKLADGQFNLGADLGGGSTDDFGKMFDHLGKRDSAMLRDPSPRRSKQYSSSPPTQALPEFQAGGSGRVQRPAPLNIDRSSAVEPSPYSWDSHRSRHSDDNLLNDPDVARMGDLVIDNSSPAHNPDAGFRRASPGSSQALGATTNHRSLERPRSDYNSLRRSGIYSGRQAGSPIDDEDAKMVRQSLLWSKESSPPLNDNTPLYYKSKTVSPDYVNPEPESMFAERHEPDPTIAAHARLAVQYAEKMPKTNSPGNKVMTPSQFEHYRQQQELRRANSSASKSEDEEEAEANEFDEEDEIEKQREAERQRRKQEAHMSIYRQQMMKVTGQQAGSPFLRPVMSGGSSSVPNLNRLSGSIGNTSSGKSNEEDDDEVPLGILAAHGFPNRNRPPSRLINVSSNPNLRASMQPPYASSSSSVVGAEQGGRGGLPVFARALPRDPYYGAGLVAGPNRESLAMGGGSGSVYGGASSPGPHPGGLVNVIANEERARAMRRGSPNTQAIYNMGEVPRPFSMMGPQPMNPNEQAQLQLSRQMADMMQMQMQWMQMQMQMQGVPGTPPPMTVNGMLAPPGMGGMPMAGPPMGPRPPSMSGFPMAGPPSMGGTPSIMGGRPVSMPGPAPGANPNFDHRALSMLDTNVAVRRTGSPMPNLSGPPFQPPNPGYASSIAPSERSNAGLASRYRPVSVMPGEGANAPSHLNTYADENQRAGLQTSQSQPHLPKSSSLATVTVHPVSPGGRKVQNTDDDDDDEAWAEMMKKRDKKKSSWKMKRGNSSLGDLLSAVH
ncbi:hypothetical protein N7448_008217 [Penicillium atrosanguineum]|uniref:Uncharacterized protein n=1 Tax=Penicillium atrosanguineum TaxID=1132637 RepID=A0A9W9UEA7_9EURO|nr:uncharacterized protein N7443_000768 [Penicillium atrosanguineum]KAJ5127438.1 hypothetical protein N7448_008217 [Penicillium atrosanguineum]KAJ5313884.1 hypothetical protein N7443_000768 [Penicillium atrosanguineum]KAJ5331055.1 hypothetical protein N7476_000838 [Penicillium atrosanguineum]